MKSLSLIQRLQLHEKSMRQNEGDIVELMRRRPHLFILGAGATKATIPNGDKYGRQSPVMENFLREIGIESQKAIT